MAANHEFLEVIGVGSNCGKIVGQHVGTFCNRFWSNKKQFSKEVYVSIHDGN